MERMRSIAVLTWASCVLLGFGNAAAAERSVLVVGRAQRAVAPDRLVWTVTVSAEDQKLQAAKAENDERISAAAVVAKDLADSSGNVELSPVRMDRMYTRPEMGAQREFSHFLVTRSLRLTQRDFSQFEKTMNALINSAEVELRYAYEISNENVIRDELRLQALDSAEAKARAMVEHMGEKLGRLEEISEFPPGEKGTSAAMQLAPPPESILGDLASPEARTISTVVYAKFAIK